MKNTFIAFFFILSISLNGQVWFKGTYNNDSIVVDLSDARFALSKGSKTVITKAVNAQYVLDQDLGDVLDGGCGYILEVKSAKKQGNLNKNQVFGINRLFIERLHPLPNGNTLIVTKDTKITIEIEELVGFHNFADIVTACVVSGGGGGDGVNIYNSDGDLEGDRAVNFDGHELVFNQGSAFIVDVDLIDYTSATDILLTAGEKVLVESPDMTINLSDDYSLISESKVSISSNNTGNFPLPSTEGIVAINVPSSQVVVDDDNAELLIGGNYINSDAYLAIGTSAQQIEIVDTDIIINNPMGEDLTPATFLTGNVHNLGTLTISNTSLATTGTLIGEEIGLLDNVAPPGDVLTADGAGGYSWAPSSGGGPGVNIYNGDGTLTSHRRLDGDGQAYDLTFQDLDGLFLTDINEIEIVTDVIDVQVTNESHTLGAGSFTLQTTGLANTGEIVVTPAGVTLSTENYTASPIGSPLIKDNSGGLAYSDLSLSSAGEAWSVLGNPSGTASNAPVYFNPSLASGIFANEGSTTTVLHGNASGNPSWGAIVSADIENGTIAAVDLSQMGASSNQVLQWNGSAWAPATISGGGTVTSFSAGNLSPLFTTSVATATSTPALTFSLSNASAYTVLGNNTSGSAAPAFFSPILASALFRNQGTATTVLHGNAAGNPSWSAITTADIQDGTITVNDIAQNGAVLGNTLVWNGSAWTAANSPGQNFANTNLAFSGDRTHDMAGYDLTISGLNSDIELSRMGAGFFEAIIDIDGSGVTIRNTNTGGESHLMTINASQIVLEHIPTGGSDLVLLFEDLPVYANDAAAGVGGLSTGMVYQTATGELRIKL